MLKTHGAKIYDDLDSGQFPKFSIPSRSVNNIVYDKKLRQYILGNASSLRSSKNTSQLRSFTQLMWLAFFANRLTQEKKSSTLRDIYYSSQAFAIDFEDQYYFQYCYITGAALGAAATAAITAHADFNPATAAEIHTVTTGLAIDAETQQVEISPLKLLETFGPDA